MFVLLLCASAVAAQEARWEPLGPTPVDQAGAGRRGYSLPVESTEVAEPGASVLSFHAVSANDFYIEQTGDFQISQRSEAHTVAFEYRRGFKAGRLPRFEVGAQLQVSESDGGFLNGFISGFEDFVRAPLRSRMATPPLGTTITKAGRPLYQSPGDGSGFGDLYVVAKAVLRDAAPSSRDVRVAARVAVNVSGASEFTEGNFAGVGVSVDKKILEWAALHGDVRTSIFMDRVSAWGLPLTRASFAFSAGPELRLPRNSSMNLQIDGATTPYVETGTIGLDANYGDITFGVNHRSTAGSRRLLTQFYARENMNLPFRVRWNTDPDFAIGVRVSVQ